MNNALGPAFQSGRGPRPKRQFWHRLGILLLVLVVALGIARAMLPTLVRDYVNRTLDRNPLHDGTIGEVSIHLWRGAYSISQVRIVKTTGNVPVPFFAARQVDFALEWPALLHGRLVGRVLMEQPEMNFVDASDAGDAETGGGGGPWLLIIRDLFPFKINSAVIRDGSVHFRAYQTAKPVDVHISKLEATIDNLGNIRDETDSLVSTVRATGVVMDHAKFEYNMTLDPFAYRPTFHLAVRLLNLDVTKINDLARAYGKFDFKRGWFDLILETDAKEGQVSGYVKPLFRNLQVFSLGEDLQQDNMLQFFWQALVGSVTRLLKNQLRDQFGTLIPFSGDATGDTTVDIFATVGNLLRNAFIRAYLPRLEDGSETVDGLTFQPAEISDPLSVSDSP